MRKILVSCLVEGCVDKYRCSGYCGKHYARWRKYGDASKLQHRGDPVETAEDFRSHLKINPMTGCLEWTRGRTKLGYGRLQFRGEDWRAHRVAWFFATGKKPAGEIRHTCDNPPCCNPDHLREGTHADNMRDIAERKRGRKSKVLANLSPQQLDALRLAKKGLSHKTVADVSREIGIPPYTGRWIVRKVYTPEKV